MAQTNSTNKLLPILIVLIGLTAAFLYKGASGPSVPPLPDAVHADDLNKFRELNNDFSLFDNPSYQLLQQYGDFPVIPGASGKTDPFSSI